MFFDEETISRLEIVANRNGCTLFMVLIALYAVVLHRYTRQKDIIIGSPISGRNAEEISGLLGFFVNTLALRFAIDPEAAFDRWLLSVRTLTLEAFNNQDAPFEMIVQRLNIPHNLGRSPVFQTMFVYQDIRNRTETMNGLEREQVIIPRTGAQTELDFWVRREVSGMSAGIDYPRI
jgi:non-ribosomal peptide synthetase component F